MVHVIIKKISLGTSKAKRQKMVLEWTSCNDTIINEIRKIFPDIYLGEDVAFQNVVALKIKVLDTAINEFQYDFA